MLRRQKMHLSKLCRALMFVTPVILIVPMVGMATITANTANTTQNTVQQTNNAPCVIGNTSCKNGGFDDVEFSGTPGGGNGSSYNIFSPSYIAANQTGVTAPRTIPTTFSIGVDTNI